MSQWLCRVRFIRRSVPQFPCIREIVIIDAVVEVPLGGAAALGLAVDGRRDLLVVALLLLGQLVGSDEVVEDALRRKQRKEGRESERSSKVWQKR